MPRFRYRAVGATGVVDEGEMEAPTREEVVLRLRQRQQTTLSAEALTTPVTPAPAAAGRAPAIGRWRRPVPLRARALLVRELATLIGAGLPVERALVVAGELGRGGTALAAVAAAEAVRRGQSLSAALAAGALALPPAALAMVRAGEVGGGLAAALETLADYLERADEAAAEVRAALIYPVILLLFAGLSLVYMFVFVVPQFEALFREAGRDLPLATALLAGLSSGLRQWGAPLLLTAALALLLLRRWRRSAAGRLAGDRWLLGLPVAGPLLAGLEAERYLRALAALLRGGVSLAEAAGLAAETIGNRAMAGLAAAAAVGLRGGQPFAAALAANSWFPVPAVELLRVGEETGSLPLMAGRAAEMEGRQSRARARRLAALGVPIVTLLLGLLVGAIVWALISSVVGLYELAR